MADLFNPPFVTILDANGNPISGGKLKFYLTGTLTPATIYADSAQTTPLTNPVIADAAGRAAAVYLDPAVTYRCRVTDASDTLIKDVDPCSVSFSSTALDDLADDIAALDLRVDALETGTATSSLFRTAPRPKKWTTPTGMNNPLGIWVDCDGREFSFSNDPYELTDWTTTEAAAINHYWLDYANGNNANTGLFPGVGGAWKTFDYFVANCVSPAVLHCVDLKVGYLSSTSGGANWGTKKIKIIGENPNGPTLFSGWRETYDLTFLALVADGAAYKTTAAINHNTVMACFDGNYPDSKGLPLKMPFVADLATCKVTPGSFWNDGSTTTAWHMIDGREPDPADGLIPVTSFSSTNFTTDGDFAAENCSFAYNGGAAATSPFRIRPNTLGSANTQKLALKNVRCFGGSGNAFELYDFEIMALKNCYGAACHYDIFNYKSFINTGTQGQWITVYEDNCFGRDAGYSWRQNPANSNSNNLSTPHLGIHVIRVNTAGYNIPNSFIAEVQGCYSMSFGVSPTESTSTGYPTNYWCQKLSGEGSTGAKMILIGCNGDAPDASKTHFSNVDDSEVSATSGEIHLADWLGPTPLDSRTGTILKNYETGATL